MSETKPEGPPTAPEKPAEPAAAAGASRGSRALLYGAGAILILLALVLGAVMVWSRISVRRLEQTLVTQRADLAEERKRALSVQGREMLRLAALPLGWAVRAEVLKDNLQQVDDYFRRFVREPGVQRMLYVDAKGVVALATDRKLEGQPATGLVASSHLAAVEPVIEETPEGLRLAIPIMAFEARAGMLIVDYALEDLEPSVPTTPAPR